MPPGYRASGIGFIDLLFQMSVRYFRQSYGDESCVGEFYLFIFLLASSIAQDLPLRTWTFSILATFFYEAVTFRQYLNDKLHPHGMLHERRAVTDAEYLHHLVFVPFDCPCG